MATEVIMPQMGESIAEGTITKWLAKVGDRVERDQPLFEISTDKVDAEIPSPSSGVLLEIKRQEGETVPVEELVAVIGEEGETPAAAEPPPPEEETVQAPPSEARLVEAAEPPPTEPAAAEPERSTGALPTLEEETAERLRKFSTPVVRRMAAEEAVELSEVPGTGIHGRVTKKDLVAYLEKRGARVATAAPQVRTAELVPEVRREPHEEREFVVPAYSEGERVEIETMSRIRQITAAHMAYSKRTSAHVTTVFHMDLSRVAKVRNRAKAGFQKAHGTKLTYMPFIFKAVANGLIANPKLNASIDGTNIVYKKDINIGMAVALDWGLLVPVIKNADRLNLVGLARTANDLADRARSKRLQPEEIQGGTFTVTNPGVFGSLIGTPIINQPQVGILGIGAIEKRPVALTDPEGSDIIAIKTMSYFSISYDHRLVDGADADHFMNHVKRTLIEETWSELDAFF
ncbi:MAG: 2-oxoglutarate dehydrogenase, E2 component, dihydrolipoamide succinyltransferase [Thermoanaerobaculia bacterium]